MVAILNIITIAVISLSIPLFIGFLFLKSLGKSLIDYYFEKKSCQDKDSLI